MSREAFIDAVLDDDPIGLWMFDGAGPGVVDESENETALTVDGPTFGGAEGPFGDAAVFDGADDFASVPLDLSGEQVVTVEVLMRWHAHAADDRLLCEFASPWSTTAGSFIVNMGNPTGGDETETLEFGFRGVPGNSRWTIPWSAISAGDWHLVSFTIRKDNENWTQAVVDGAVAEKTPRGTGNEGGTFADDTLFFFSRLGTSLFGGADVAAIAVYAGEPDAEAHWAAVEEDIDPPDPDPPTEPVTLYVDADHEGRGDEWTREQAGDDPDSPFATPQAAALVALPGDTIVIEPSTLGQADPGNTADPDMYPPIHHLQENDGQDVIPWADAGGQDPITVAGHIVDELRPKIAGINARGMRNWHFSGLQQGYDRDSGHDQNTNGLLHACADLVFTDVVYTGGGYYCIGCTGVIHWDQCETYSRYTSGGGFLSGNGFRVLAVDTSDGIWRDVIYRFTGCLFADIEGEDAIQCSLAGDHGELEVLGCTFRDIAQAVTPGAPHTDCIQSLGGKRYLIVGNRFIACSSPYIASDGYTALAVIVGNLVDGIGNGFHGQGTVRWIVAHNTILTPGPSIAIGDRFNTQSDPGFEQNATIVNNLAGDIDIAGGALLHGDSVIAGNTFYRQPGLDLGYGENVAGLPELGTSERLTLAGLEGNYELANDPHDSPGVGGGIALDSDVIEDPDLLALTVEDLLGRPFADPPDSGCLQSDPGTSVAPAPRAPYVIGLTPTPNSVASRTVTPTATLYPVPGQTIDPSTVTTGTALVRDSATGSVIPAVVTIGEPDENGYQLLSIDLKASLDPEREASLWPRVLFEAVLEGIEDTDGSAIVPVWWTFRSDGPSGPAVYPEGGAIGGWVAGALA